jgi:SAM-dependent methyltransferase
MTEPRRAMENYRDADNLKTRIGIYAYRRPEFDPVDYAAGLLPERLGLVLDVGCGHGRYTGRVRADHPEATVVGIDKSPGMLAEVAEPVMVADAQAIPYPDGCADAVLAMHMLYHVPDIDKAVAEFRRVLRPGGVLLASTNARDDMAALYALWDRAFAAVPQADGFSSASEVRYFDSANAPGYLEAAFASVEAFEARGHVAVPEPGPIVRYFRSARSFFDCDQATFDAVVEAAEGLLAEHFAAHETFDFEKANVFYRCR